MTLFGRTFGAEEIASLVFLLMALVFWIIVWRRDRDSANWFRTWESDRKARREAELATGQGGEAAPPSSGQSEPRGPWG